MTSHPQFRRGIFGLLAVLLMTGASPRLACTQEGPQGPGPQAPAPAEQPEAPAPPSGQPQKQQTPPPPVTTIAVQTNIVHVDAIVTDADGNLVTDLKRENFRLTDDGQQQEIANFAPTEQPLTTVMLVEYSSTSYNFFGFKSAYWADGFLRALKPQDWIALKVFDLNTTLQVDFTQNKSEIDDALRSLGFPGFHESNLFDAVFQTVDQLRDVKGKKSILVIATGFDTFSKHTLDQILHRLKEADVTIFCVGMGEEIDLYTPNGGGVGYAQAKNQLSTFARMTGGYAYFPRFTGEMPGIFNTIATYLRSQYTLAFTPTTPQDGHYHKIVIQVVDDEGNTLELVNGKGKKKKVQVEYREGYTAANTPAGN
jgi:VWFA-related protein